MNVMVKKDGEYFKINIEDLLNGLGDGTSSEETTVRMYEGIVKVTEITDGYRVLVHETNINRKINIGNIAVFQNGNGILSSYLQTIGVTSEIELLLRSWYDDKGLQYKTKKGFYLKFDMYKRSDGYYINKERVSIGRSKEEIARGRSLIIYPNIFTHAKMCWGNVNMPKIAGIHEIGKIFAKFMSSNVNTDLSKIVIDKSRFYGMLTDLRDNGELPNDIYKDRAESVVRNIIQKMEREGGVTSTVGITISVYVLILLANVYQKDMDWMHARIYRN